jgi:hypothetical protein
LKAVWISAALALLLVGAWSLRLRPHTYSIGDEALLEIYTLHAANGTLRVGPYSRFAWNHPGPTYFYLLAPSYALSGYREDGLYLAVLAINVVLLATLLTTALGGGGPQLAYPLMILLTLYFARPGVGWGWDFGDVLSSSWNPHTPLIPLALLVVLSAAVASGRIGLLPLAVFVASLAAQTHVGFAPVCGVLVLTGLGLFAILRKPLGWTDDRGDLPRLPVWARLLDVVALVYLGLLGWVIAFGAFDLEIAGIRIVRAGSVGRLALYAGLALVVRHLLVRRPPSLRRRITRWLGRHRAGAWVERVHSHVRPAFPPVDRSALRRALVVSAVVAVLVWALPLVEELRSPGSGNLAELAEFFGRATESDKGSAFAAFTYYLSRSLAPRLEVAAGGRIWTAADMSAADVAWAMGQLALVGIAFWWTASRRKLFLAMLCLVCLIVSAAAYAALARIQGDVHDHLAFWVSIVGLLNVAAIAAATLGWIGERRAAPPRGAAALPHRVACMAFTVVIAIYGAAHVIRGHHHRRFQHERDRVQRLSSLVESQVGGSVTAVDMTQGTWSVAAGVVLELYKDAVTISVADRWLFLFGSPLMAKERAGVELLFTEAAEQAALAGDPGYRLIGEDQGVFVYTRTP